MAWMQAALPCRFLLRVFLAFAISVSLSSDPDTNACGRPEGKSKLSNRFAKIGDLTPKRANDLLWWGLKRPMAGRSDGEPGRMTGAPLPGCGYIDLRDLPHRAHPSAPNAGERLRMPGFPKNIF
jgi:hypothetical protein